MSSGLDTTVILRLIVGEPQAQTELARSRPEDAVTRGESVSVSDLVVEEAYYALQYHYELEKEAPATCCAMLLSGATELEPRTSLPALDRSRSPGLVDRLITTRSRAEGSVTPTLDRRLAGVGLLSRCF